MKMFLILWATKEEMQRRIASEICLLKRQLCRYNQNLYFGSERIPVLGDEGDDPLYLDVPRLPRTKSERKPYPTPMKLLIQRAKKDREARKAEPCRLLQDPPDNGLLVPELVHVAHQVYWSRQSLLSGLSKLVLAVPVQRCRFHLLLYTPFQFVFVFVFNLLFIIWAALSKPS